MGHRDLGSANLRTPNRVAEVTHAVDDSLRVRIIDVLVAAGRAREVPSVDDQIPVQKPVDRGFERGLAEEARKCEAGAGRIVERRLDHSRCVRPCDARVAFGRRAGRHLFVDVPEEHRLGRDDVPHEFFGGPFGARRRRTPAIIWYRGNTVGESAGQSAIAVRNLAHASLLRNGWSPYCEPATAKTRGPSGGRIVRRRWRRGPGARPETVVRRSRRARWLVPAPSDRAGGRHRAR